MNNHDNGLDSARGDNSPMNHQDSLRRSLPVIGLNRGRQSVRGFTVKAAIIQLKCETRMSNTEIGEAIGRSRQWVGKVWKTAVREAEQAAIDPEKRKELKVWLIHQVIMTITKAQGKVNDHAAYGALVLKGVEQIHTILGLDSTTGNEGEYSVPEIASQLDSRSPLVMAKLKGLIPAD